MKSALRTFALAAATALISGGALADGRAPNADERTAIEGALKGGGYSAWGKIELDDKQYWEVDDAVGADGKKYDLDVALDGSKILKTDLDTDD